MVELKLENNKLVVNDVESSHIFSESLTIAIRDFFKIPEGLTTPKNLKSNIIDDESELLSWLLVNSAIDYEIEVELGNQIL